MISSSKSIGRLGLSVAALGLASLAFQNCSQSLPSVDQNQGVTTQTSQNSQGGSAFYGDPSPGPNYVPNPASTAAPDVPVYRMRDATGDYLMTIDPQEVAAAKSYGFVSEGTQLKIFSVNTGPRVAVYRCYDKKLGHFLSPDPRCEGYGVEGRLGFTDPVATAPAPNRLVRCVNASGRHLVTANPNGECTTQTGLGREDAVDLGFAGI